MMIQVNHCILVFSYESSGLLRAPQKLTVAAEVGKTEASASYQTSSKTRLYWEVPATLVSIMDSNWF